MDIKVFKTATPKAKPDQSKLGFGRYFTDHMFIMEHDATGWHDARIVPYGDLSISPASTVLHYGAEIFEGLKAYRLPDGSVQLFRPEENAKRMINSAERLCLPQVSVEDFMTALKALIEIDKAWVPYEEGTALYIRPFEFANAPFLGVHAVQDAVFIIILSPVGAYYAEGLNPVKIAIEDVDVRAVRGGTGYAKCGGNYAASLRAGEKAEEKGYAQVLWLDGVERKYIEEVGSMNVMFKIGDEIVTPKLTGSVLPGITRKSCVELLKEFGVSFLYGKREFLVISECISRELSFVSVGLEIGLAYRLIYDYTLYLTVLELEIAIRPLIEDYCVCDFTCVLHLLHHISSGSTDLAGELHV